MTVVEACKILQGVKQREDAERVIKLLKLLYGIELDILIWFGGRS